MSLEEAVLYRRRFFETYPGLERDGTTMKGEVGYVAIPRPGRSLAGGGWTCRG